MGSPAAAGESMLAWKWTCPYGQRKHGSILANLLAYGQRSSSKRPTDIGTAQTAGQLKNKGANIMPPLQAMLCIVYRGITTYRRCFSIKIWWRNQVLCLTFPLPSCSFPHSIPYSVSLPRCDALPPIHQRSGRALEASQHSSPAVGTFLGAFHVQETGLVATIFLRRRRY